MTMARLQSSASTARLRIGVLLFAMFAVLLAKTIWAQAPSHSREDSVRVQFTDIRKAAGITFIQDSAESDQKYYLETMGSGVAWIDYNQDGLMDLYFVQSGATGAYKPSHPLRSALYRNNGDGTFTDVTEKAGVGGEGHYRSRRRGRGLRQRRLPRYVSSPAMAAPFFITTTGTEPSPM